MNETPYLLEYLFCCQFTTNNNVIDIFEDLATQRLKCPTTTKLKSYEEDYYRLYVDVLKHFKIKDVPASQDKHSITNWSSIRKKALKDLILKNFIIKVKRMYNFEEETTNNLKRDLVIGLNFKTVNDKNIIFKDSEIDSIKGLNLGLNTYSWDYDVFLFNSK
jgi:hypothetical protein